MNNKLTRDIIIITILCGALLWGAFQFSHDTSATVEKIFIGFFYSLLFFFLIEDLPVKLRQNKYRKIIFKELLYTDAVIKNLIHSLKIRDANLPVRAKELIHASPEKITIHDVHRSEIYSRAHKLETLDYQSIGGYLSFAQRKIKQVKRRLEKFTFVVDTQLLDLIIEVEKFQLSWISEILKDKVNPAIFPQDIVPDLQVILDLEIQLETYIHKHMSQKEIKAHTLGQ